MPTTTEIMSPVTQAAAAEELLRRRRARSNLLDFIVYTYPGYRVGQVHRAVCSKLDRFLDDVLNQRRPRLLLFMPPRHGKSEMVSRRLPAYAFGRDPDINIIATSYGADLSSRMNRDVQRIMDSPEYLRLFPHTRLFGKNIRTMAHGKYLRNSDIFEIVDRDGVYRSAGVGGGITGMGFDIGIIDDPIKDAREARSKTYRDAFWEWYLQTFLTRSSPGGGILGIWTRWHHDDGGGRLIEAMQKGGDVFEVCSFPAIANEDDPLGRRPGEALWPECYPLETLTQIRNTPGEDGAGSSAFAALYQQNPEIDGGNIFKREWWRFYRETTKLRRVIQSWDTAFKKDEGNDFSCRTSWGEGQADFFMLDCWKDKLEYPELRRAMILHAEKEGPAAILVEDKASGQSLIQDLLRNTTLPITPVKVDSDKVTRAHAVTALIECGKVSLPEGAPWVSDYIDSMSAFPAGRHDDDVDSTTQALNWLNKAFAGRGLMEHMRRQAEAAVPPSHERHRNHVGVVAGVVGKLEQIGGVPSG